MLLGVEQVKGTPESLDGRLTVFARIEMDPHDVLNARHPAAGMIHNGLLTVQGNYRDQYSLKDFLHSEMGVSLDEGLEQLLSRLDGLEGALDPEKLREKLREMEGMDELIPTPAKFVTFHSEVEITGQEGDVFDVGMFTSVGNAMHSVNAFPMLYQARYREQAIHNVRNEIDRLVGQVERNEGDMAESYGHAGMDVAQRLAREFIPDMLYSRRDAQAFDSAQQRFRQFLRGYPQQEDIDSILGVLQAPGEMGHRELALLELYAKKMAAVARKDVAGIEQAPRAIIDLQRGPQ